MKILFVGDIMPGGVAHYQSEYVSAEVKTWLRGFDLRIGTLKCPILDDKRRYERMTKSNTIWTKKEDIRILSELQIDVLSLASSHILDYGLEGLQSTIEALDEIGVGYCGCGTTEPQATKPVVVETEGKRIAVLAYQDSDKSVGEQKFADGTEYGVARLDIKSCCNRIKECKKQYDYVFVLPQWSTEYSHKPRVGLGRYAHEMIKAGADGVFGAHAHVPQPVVRFRGKPVAYNMGNFYFPDFVCSAERPVCYPDMDIANIYRTEEYLDSWSDCFVRVWPQIARVNNPIEVDEVEGALSFRMRLLLLNSGNVLVQHQDTDLLKRLRRIGRLHELGYYWWKRMAWAMLSVVKRLIVSNK